MRRFARKIKRYLDRVGSCRREFVRYLIELRAVRSLFGRIQRYSIELGAV